MTEENRDELVATIQDLRALVSQKGVGSSGSSSEDWKQFQEIMARIDAAVPQDDLVKAANPTAIPTTQSKATRELNATPALDTGLLPCPMCGNHGSWRLEHGPLPGGELTVIFYRAECSRSRCGIRTQNHSTRESARTVWNTRPAPPVCQDEPVKAPPQRMVSTAYGLCFAASYPLLQALARQHGYALAIHGSMATDFDLIAVPWILEPDAPEVLIETIRSTVNGRIDNDPLADEYDETRRNPVLKSHRRLAWSIYLNDGRNGPYIDISVMPAIRAVSQDEAPEVVSASFDLKAHNERAIELSAQLWLEDFNSQRTVKTPRDAIYTHEVIADLLKMVRRQGVELLRSRVVTAPPIADRNAALDEAAGICKAGVILASPPAGAPEIEEVLNSAAEAILALKDKDEAPPVVDSEHPEDRCGKCGGRNVVWFAPSPIWNLAVRAKGEPEIICPVCFVQLAEAAGIQAIAWMVSPERLTGDYRATATELAEWIGVHPKWSRESMVRTIEDTLADTARERAIKANQEIVEAATAVDRDAVLNEALQIANNCLQGHNHSAPREDEPDAEHVSPAACIYRALEALKGSTAPAKEEENHG